MQARSWGLGGCRGGWKAPPPPAPPQLGKKGKKVQFFTLALGQGPQSTKKTPPLKIQATGLKCAISE